MGNDQVTDPRARAFADALQEFEESSDPEVLTRLFADGATLFRLDARGERSDPEAFWREYRGQFQEVSTTFGAVVEGGDAFALEWTSEATLPGDRQITYRGVTVIELDGDAISRLRTYYDSAVFATATPAGTQ